MEDLLLLLMAGIRHPTVAVAVATEVRLRPENTTAIVETIAGTHTTAANGPALAVRIVATIVVDTNATQ